MICPKCKKEVLVRYRDKTKDKMSDFVCAECLPFNLIPKIRNFKDLEEICCGDIYDALTFIFRKEIGK